MADFKDPNPEQTENAAPAKPAKGAPVTPAQKAAAEKKARIRRERALAEEAERARRAEEERLAAIPDDLTIEDVSADIPEAPELFDFLVGTLPGSPVQNATLAGVSVPQYSGGGTVGSNRTSGARVQMSVEQLELFKAALRKRVVRFANLPGGERRGTLLSVDTPGFVAEVGDEPFAKYVYCRRITREQAKVEEALPRSMAG